VVDEDEVVVVVVVGGDVVVVVVVVGGGPVEMMMVTVLPGGTDAPGPGVDEMTAPVGCWVEACDGPMFTLRPALPNTLPAWVCWKPMTDGTSTLDGPEDT
jgi:hypothetical protein